MGDLLCNQEAESRFRQLGNPRRVSIKGRWYNVWLQEGFQAVTRGRWTLAGYVTRQIEVLEAGGS